MILHGLPIYMHLFHFESYICALQFDEDFYVKCSHDPHDGDDILSGTRRSRQKDHQGYQMSFMVAI